MGEDHEGRRFYRVATALPLRCRRVDPDDVPAVAERIAMGADAALTAMPPELAAWAKRIEDKLDALLARFDPTSPVPLGTGDLQSVVLSGSGILLGSDEDLLPGDDVLLEFLLPETPPRRVEALGQVVGPRVSEPEGQDRIAVRFGTIGEADRQAIVRTVYQVEVFTRRRDGEGEAP